MRDGKGRENGTIFGCRADFYFKVLTELCAFESHVKIEMHCMQDGNHRINCSGPLENKEFLCLLAVLLQLTQSSVFHFFLSNYKKIGIWGLLGVR